MVRDFSRLLRGTDYFHEPPQLGNFLADHRSYFYDFSIKATWPGPWEGGVPLLYVPAWSTSAIFPIMVLQFGIGCLELYFRGDMEQLPRIEAVVGWIKKSLAGTDSFDNLFPKIHPEYQYFSANSALAQGHALSFLCRIREHLVLPREKNVVINQYINRIYSNMVRPISEGGTALFSKEDLYFCEMCRRDEYVVLNGWIYAIFGLMDYKKIGAGSTVEGVLHRTLRTLEKTLPSYLLPDGWSMYDNKGRVSSPIYHGSHVVLMEAISRLTLNPVFKKCADRFDQGNSLLNKIYYTLKKIIEKIRDKQKYLTH